MVAIETEMRFAVGNRQEMLGSLMQENCRMTANVREVNDFYDLPDGSLRGRDCGLRVRSCNDSLGTCDVSYGVLTWKGPPTSRGLDQRPEIETHVDDPDAARRILEALGYVRWLRFERWRCSFIVRDCRVELDQLPELGDFLEIEGRTPEMIERLRAKLGLAAPPMERNYPEMVMAHLRGGRSELLFPK